MSNQITTQTISFHGSDLITLKVEDVIFTAVKPIVEAMGLDWGGQQQKLSKSGDKFGCRDISMPTNGGLQKMICMPIKKLNGWLFSINPEKVRSDLKEKVICYQEECFEALYNYWHFGKAERKTTVDERTGLRNAVNMLVSKKGLIYSDAYNLVHHYMNVESIEDIPAEKLPMAVEYVHKICLEGELIIDEPKNINILSGDIVVPVEIFGAIMQHTRLARRLAEKTEDFHRQLFEMLGLERYVRNDIAALSHDVKSEFDYFLDQGEEIVRKHQKKQTERNYERARLRNALRKIN